VSYQPQLITVVLTVENWFRKRFKSSLKIVNLMVNDMLKPKQIERIISLRKEGYTYEDIAKKVGVSVSSVKKYSKLKSQQVEAESFRSALKPLETAEASQKPLEEVVKENRGMIRKILELLCDEGYGLLNEPLRACVYGENEEVCIKVLDEAEFSHVEAYIQHRPRISQEAVFKEEAIRALA
jgi:predicted transcriptional regulator